MWLTQSKLRINFKHLNIVYKYIVNKFCTNYYNQKAEFEFNTKEC